MIYEYDLVVIGDSPEAEFAAERAGRLRSRVAWVTQVPAGKAQDPSYGGNPELQADVIMQVLRQALTQLDPLEAVADPQGLWEKARGYAAITVAERDPQRLQQVGVDVIEGLGQFETRPRLQLNVEVPGGMRELRSRNYLLAPSAVPVVSSVWAQLSRSIDTLHSWTHWEHLPEHVTLLNPYLDGLVLAQLLARLGCAVTVVNGSRQRLPDWIEPEFAQLIDALLKAAGVELRPGFYDEVEILQLNPPKSPDPHSPKPERGWTIAAEIDGIHHRWESDRLLVATYSSPQWQKLNLREVGLLSALTERHNQAYQRSTPITCDRRLRTKHRQIYVGGAGCGIHLNRGAREKHRAEVALRNALWWPWWKPRQGLGYWPIRADFLPALIKVGYGEAQARHRYPGKVSVVCQYAHNNAYSQRVDHTVGLCKLVVHHNGRLLGAHAMAVGAEDWMAIAALIIQNKGSVRDLEKLSLSPASSASLLYEAAAKWRWERLAETPRREDLIERFFNWRRTGSV